MRADESELTVGNFRAALKGIELFRYDRTHYGAQAKFNVKKGDFRHELTVVGTDESVDQRHTYVELQGTGGSLYYLPHRELVEGQSAFFSLNETGFLELSEVERL